MRGPGRGDLCVLRLPGWYCYHPHFMLQESEVQAVLADGRACAEPGLSTPCHVQCPGRAWPEPGLSTPCHVQCPGRTLPWGCPALALRCWRWGGTPGFVMINFVRTRSWPPGWSCARDGGLGKSWSSGQRLPPSHPIAYFSGTARPEASRSRAEG